MARCVTEALGVIICLFLFRTGCQTDTSALRWTLMLDLISQQIGAQLLSQKSSMFFISSIFPNKLSLTELEMASFGYNFHDATNLL